MDKLFDIFVDSSKARQLENENHYKTIHKGLLDSMNDFNEALEVIGNWDELMNLKDESPQDNKLMRHKTIKEEFKDKRTWFDLLGVIFNLFQIMGVQASIIILNALFSELVAEFQLWAVHTPRDNNFYEKLEICTYRELPEIDIGMVTSSLGIIVLKSLGFRKTNSIFQLLSAVLLLILLLLFNFHKGNELLENYSRLELVILALSYIVISILVGGSSLIGLKEYFNVIDEIYYKAFKSEDDTQKFAFYSLSGLSLLFIMLINRKIFKSFSDTKSTVPLIITIMSIIFICYFLSLIFHYLFMIPVGNTRENMKKKKREKLIDINLIKLKNKEKNQGEQKGKVNNTEVIENKNTFLKVNEEFFTINKEENKINKRKKNLQISKFENIKSNIYSESAEVKIDNSFQKEHKNLDEISIRDIIGKSKTKNIYSTKVCTICGYFYLRKKINNKPACICYYYTGRCSWFCEKFCKYDVGTTLAIEFYSQLCIVGYNRILSDKLLNVYAYSTIVKFYLALFFLSILFGLASVPQSSQFNESIKEGSGKKNAARGKEDTFKDKFCGKFLSYLLFLLAGYSFLAFISSICYCYEDNLNRTRWDNIYMAEFIYFKCIDLSILSFYDFFDNTDIFNTTLFITFEKFLWMLFEAIFDAYIENNKTLIIIQSVISGIPSFIFFLSIICYFCDCC